MRRVLQALCLLQALALGACATHTKPASSTKQDGPAQTRQASAAAAAKTAAANKRAAKAAAAEKAEEAKVAAAQKAAAEKAAAAERAAAAKAAAQAKAEAAKAAAQAKAEAARVAAAAARAERIAKAEERARAQAAAKAEAIARAEAKAQAEAAARAEAVARAQAKARADALARAEAKARADAVGRADAQAKAEAAARANAVARSEAAERAEAAEKALAPQRAPVLAQATTARAAEPQKEEAPPAVGDAKMMATSLRPATTPAEQVATESPRDYVVGGGDVLRISVFQSPDLSLEARVSESGTISYPLLGQLSVGGLSIPKVEATIARRLREGQFLKQPQVSVMLQQVRANQVSVLGMANRPGRYPIEVNGMLLSELLALAGGVAPGGSEIVTLSGTRNGKPFRQRFDVNALFANGGAHDENPVVSSGDTLYIERLPNVYIYGEVQRPGPIPLTADMTLMQAVASGGGLTDRGTERGMRVHRRDPSGEVQVVQPKMDEVLQPGDVVYVRESLF